MTRILILDTDPADDPCMGIAEAGTITASPCSARQWEHERVDDYDHEYVAPRTLTAEMLAGALEREGWECPDDYAEALFHALTEAPDATIDGETRCDHNVLLTDFCDFCAIAIAEEWPEAPDA